MKYKINHFSYDDSNGLVQKENDEIQLTKTQAKLFNYFIAHPGKTISKETLMENVWDRVVTMNSIERTLSILRASIELDPSDPQLLITHFGHGVSFEGKVECISETVKKNNRFKLASFILLPVLLAAFYYFFTSKDNKPTFNSNVQKQISTISQDQSLLLLPTVFEGIDDEVLEKGSDELVKKALSSIDAQGQILFDERDIPARQIMEQNWIIDKELVIIQTKVVKNGEIYDAVMQFSKGFDTIKTVNLTAGNLTELSTKQLQSVSQLYNGIPQLLAADLIATTSEQKYLKALGYQKTKNYEKAKGLLTQLLNKDENNHLARYSLAGVLLDQKEFDESLAHLVTLRNTPLYQTRGAAIEFLASIILNQKNQFQQVISTIDTFLVSHDTKISPYQHAKLLLQKARAHMDLGDMLEALKLYKLCIVELDDNYYPDVYASSYLGQAVILSMKSSNDEVMDLYYKSVSYAEKQGNLRILITSLNALSLALYSKNQWQEGIAVIKKSIGLMDAENTDGTTDKSDVAYGLSVLSLYLYERGLFTQAEKVLNRLETIAKDLQSDALLLIMYNHQAYLAVYKVDYDFAQRIIDKQYKIASETNNYGYLLNNTFVQLELLVQSKNTELFEKVYQERIKLFAPESLERYKIYMHWFLARSYLILNKNEQAQQLLNTVSEQALSFADTKLHVDAQTTLAKSYLKNNPQKALDILNTLAQHNPNPNPYLWIKAKALVELNRKLDALTTLNLAKQAFNEAWSAENQKLLDELN